MTLKLTLPIIVVVGGLAAFVAYLVAGDFAAASWSAISTVLATVLLRERLERPRRTAR